MFHVHVSSFFSLFSLGNDDDITGDITPQQPPRFVRFAILWFNISLVMFTRTEMTLFQFTLSIVKTLLNAE